MTLGKAGFTVEQYGSTSNCPTAFSESLPYQSQENPSSGFGTDTGSQTDIISA
jgi:hypothetical protein